MSANAPVRIIGLRLHKGDTSRGGPRPIAFFECEVRGIALRGCAVMVKEGRAYASPPTFGKEKVYSGITFADPALKAEVTDAACAAYRALGGTELDASNG